MGLTAPRIELLVRAGCAACGRAREDLARICGPLDVPVTEVDVDEAAAAGDGEPRAEYGDRLPVVLLDGELAHDAALVDDFVAALAVDAALPPGLREVMARLLDASGRVVAQAPRGAGAAIVRATLDPDRSHRRPGGVVGLYMPALPEAVLVVIDATNLACNLVLAGEVLRRRLPTLVVLNMVDLSRKHQIHAPGVVEWGTTPRDFFERKAAIIWTTTGNLTNVRNNAKFPFGVAMLPANKRRGSPTGWAARSSMSFLRW